MLKAPGSKRLTLKYDEPLSNFAFKFNLRRYIMGLPQCSAAEMDAALTTGSTATNETNGTQASDGGGNPTSVTTTDVDGDVASMPSTNGTGETLAPAPTPEARPDQICRNLLCEFDASPQVRHVFRN
jgi:hypothetical protein